MVIVYKKVITAFLNFTTCSPNPTQPIFKAMKSNFLLFCFESLEQLLFVCWCLKIHENSEFVVSEFRWLDLVNKTLYNNMEFSRQMTRTQGAELEIVPYCS